MIKRNPHLAKLNAGYLFPEINRRKREFLKNHPEAQLISLGIGDTTEPIPPYITKKLVKAAADLGTKEGYTGYGHEQGMPALRKKISEQLYNNQFKEEEVFVSDGSKCDIGRLQQMFGAAVTTAVQDPSYPVYVDSAVIIGQTGGYHPETMNYHDITYMPCKPENDFFPDLNQTPRTDLIYFCSPNNPTGAVTTRDQLTELVKFAHKNRSIIIFDAAYAVYIKDPNLPKSIYEIPGSREVAIELGSFSKMIGFTGVRLGWSIIPNELCYEDGTPVNKDWSRLTSTIFNGASNMAQMGGLAALDPEGLVEMQQMVTYYMENASILKQAFADSTYKVYGGVNTPYLWINFGKRRSWDIFEEILQDAHLVTTPGSGFGPAGEGFIRLSSFGHRENILEAANRLKSFLKSR